jgi:thioredoxin-like negative regulator of GroEL
MYAAGAIYNKQDAVAQDLLKSYTKEQIAANNQILQAYYATGQYQRLIEIWKIRVAQNPKDTNSRVSLAAAYLLLKRQEECNCRTSNSNSE